MSFLQYDSHYKTWDLYDVKVRLLKRYQAGAYYGLLEEWDLTSNPMPYSLSFFAPRLLLQERLTDHDTWQALITGNLLLHSLGRVLL